MMRFRIYYGLLNTHTTTTVAVFSELWI